jgi:hypothetical protein
MPKVAILMMSVIGLALVYLGSLATLCVALDRALAGRVALLRILVPWFVPLLGAIVSHGIPQATAALALGGSLHLKPRETPCLAVRFLL